MKMKKNKKFTQHGITLVALVVTIVVLLILAGITITYVMGDNSIFKQAQDAKDKTEQAKGEEKEYIDNLGTTIQDKVDGIVRNPQIGPDKKGEILTADKSDYIEEIETETGKKTITAVIPGGFCVVKDIEGDENTIERGLVISDKANDDLNNTAHGNQFVWIPVPNYEDFHLIEGYYNKSLDTMLSVEDNSAETVAREAGDSDSAGSPSKPNPENSVKGTDESKAMYKSVKDNGGFYIARFEAGITGTAANSTLTTKTKTDGTVAPLSQKGVGVWNGIRWGANEVSLNDGLNGNDETDGAVKVARNMYPASDTTHKVTSTLCYGVQWDAALKFIDKNYGEYNEAKTDYKVAENSYVKNSTGMGHYGASAPTTTGSAPAYQKNHIYDMAGNVYEWTMEAYNTDGRVNRGGGYYSVGGRHPASSRINYGPGNGYDYVGFRPALYL